MTARRGEPLTWRHLAMWDEHGSMHLGATRARLPCNDSDAGDAIMAERPGELHYVPGDGTWYVWDGRCHRPDREDGAGKVVNEWARRQREMLRHARAMVAARVQEELRDGGREPPEAALRAAFRRAWSGEGWEAAEKYAAGLMRSAGLSALEKYLRTLCGTSGEVFEFSRADGFLNCANGTVNLATGELRPHNPAQMITYCLETEYHPAKSGEALQFWGMLCRVTADADSAGYLLRVLGYSLLGRNPEHLFPFLAGPAGSGKTKVLWMVARVLGELAHSAGTDLIASVPHGRNARTENSIRGRRLVVISEMSSRIKMDEAQVKRLTGEPEVAVNQHYAKTEIRTPVSWLLFGATNDLPSVSSFDGGLRRRIAVIPGGPGLEPWEVDTGKAEKVLAAESEAILAMLVRACRQYFREGLPRPLAVDLETARYVAEQDTIDAFTAECCDMKPDAAVGGPAMPWEVPASALWLAYREWARGLAYLGRNEFYAGLGKKGGVTYDRSRHRFLGIRLNAEWSMKA